VSSVLMNSASSPFDKSFNHPTTKHTGDTTISKRFTMAEPPAKRQRYVHLASPNTPILMITQA
jgi:hypothetical protein